MLSHQDYNLTKPAYSVNELLKIMPLGRTKLYSLIKSGSLVSKKIGKNTWFLAPDITAFLDSLNDGGSNAARR